MAANISKKVLIVEDDFALSDAFCMILTHSGYDVSTAHHSKEALEFLEDVCLIDIARRADASDGWTSSLRQFPNAAAIPIVALSNLDSKADIEEVISLGAQKYMLKSVTPATASLVEDTLHKV